MIEDQLDKDQRIRLEALAQATSSLTMHPNSSVFLIISRANNFERYIREGGGVDE